MNGNLEPEESVMEQGVELMYKAPGRVEHQSIVEVLDEIMNRLDRIESHLDEGVERLDTIEREGAVRLDRIESVGGALLNKINVDVEEILEEVAS